MIKKIIILVVILAIVGVGYFLYSKKVATAQTLTLLKDTGSIMYKAESGEYIPLTTEKLQIPNKSFVKTGDDALAHVILPDNSMISLSASTEMQINYSPEKTYVYQTLGNAWFRIKKLSGMKEFDVETPTSVASVRGTIFGVERGLEDVIYVTESTVEIAQLKTEGDKKIKENILTLTENKLANIGAFESGTPKIIDIPADKMQTPWFRRNIIINKQFNDGLPDDFVNKLHQIPEIIQIDQEFALERTSKTVPTGDMTGSYSWLSGNQGCSYISSAEYSTAVSELKSSGAMLGSWGEWIINAIDTMQKACSDGVIDPIESAAIQSYYESQPEPTFILPQ